MIADDGNMGRGAIEGAQILHLPGQEPIKFSATPFKWREPSTFDRRQFLYGFELRRGQLSAMIAPGAAGKTTLKVARALCMVTGNDYLGHTVWNGPHRVWLWNLEDEAEEIHKAVAAFMILWNIQPEQIGDRLFIDGADHPDAPMLKLAVEDKVNGITIRRPVVDGVVAELLARKIDYLDVDPFVSSHSVSENDNGAIDLVSKQWITVGRLANCAVGLTHHVRKLSKDGGDATAFDARGAVAMINAARSCLVLNRMGAEQAETLGIPACDRRKYFSVYDDKNNKAPPALKAEWYEFVGVGLGNGDATGPEDNIGAVKRWMPPDDFGGVTQVELLAIQRAIDLADVDVAGGRVRKDAQSPRYVGRLVATKLDLNLSNPADRQRIRRMLQTWLANGALKIEQGKDKRGEYRDFVIVGNPVIPET